MSSPRSRPSGKARRRPLDPHPRLWAAFAHGQLLRAVLEDFYERVYADPRLAPFFVHTTKSWAIDHQYAFLRQILTGEDVYFGDRPRNAHHWMVITDELFDHREAVMAATLRDHGLADDMIAELRTIEEQFRSHIVKAAPFPRKRQGRALPLDGWDPLALSAGGLCDGCHEVIAIAATAWCHRRTGETRCATCAPAEALAEAS